MPHTVPPVAAAPLGSSWMTSAMPSALVPTVGGVSLTLVTLLTVPVLFSAARELELRRAKLRHRLLDEHEEGPRDA